MNCWPSPAAGPALSPDDVRNFVLPLLDSRQYDELQKKKSVDFCFVRDPVGRFRQHVARSAGRRSAANVPAADGINRYPALRS
jgi:Tfp pilus assembly pilus retraction ATPase PilT